MAPGRELGMSHRGLWKDPQPNGPVGVAVNHERKGWRDLIVAHNEVVPRPGVEGYAGVAHPFPSLNDHAASPPTP